MGGGYAYICIALAKRCVLTIFGEKRRHTIKNTLTTSAAPAAAAATASPPPPPPPPPPTTTTSVWKQSDVTEKTTEQTDVRAKKPSRVAWKTRTVESLRHYLRAQSYRHIHHR